LPFADTEMMQLHLDEISRHVEKGAHAVLLLDRAGWHTTAKLALLKKITPILLPLRAPELDPLENVWQCLRREWLSNCVYESYGGIIDAACDARPRPQARAPMCSNIVTGAANAGSQLGRWLALDGRDGLREATPADYMRLRKRLKGEAGVPLGKLDDALGASFKNPQDEDFKAGKALHLSSPSLCGKLQACSPHICPADGRPTVATC
jgi:hypothetical protein